MTIRIPAVVSDAFTVVGNQPGEATLRGSIAGESLEAIPVRSRGRGLQDAVATLPGWMTEDNGLLHSRGVDDGFLYVIDGVPVYERMDALHGFAPDLTSVSGISVITGYIPPEFGHKAGGVIDVRSAVAPPSSWNGHADVGFGSDAAREGSFAAGGQLSATARLRGGFIGTRTDRFLDPVDPDNLHNTGGHAATFGEIGWSPTTDDRVAIGWGLGRSSFDVPNTIEQDEANQNQRQRLRQGFLHATWQHTWSPVTVAQVTLYHRRTSATLLPSDFDVPITADADRELTRSGGLLAVTRQHHAHLFKVGVEFQRLSLREAFSFAVTDEEEAEDSGFREEALEFTPADPFVFAGTDLPSLLSMFAQDSWQLASRVTLSGGLRFDRSTMLLERTQLSPRVGVAARVGPSTVIRASVSRFFQPPQPENLLLSSSPEARVLSSTVVGEAEGGADVEPERQWATEAGVEHQLSRRLRLDVAVWDRRVRHVADPNVFAGTTIIFPNAVAKGRAHGLDARLELARDAGWSGYVSASTARVIQTGPVTGGLFLEDDVEEIGDGEEFTPDHDQRFAAAMGVTWTHSTGVAVSATGRYETGTPIQQEDNDLDELRGRPGAAMVDFEEGRVKPRGIVSLRATAPVMRRGDTTVEAALEVLNLLDARYAYNFGNPFSGTHFGAPRSVGFSVRAKFR
jgi:outer membrane receptor protein involved in Fe transport